MDGEVTCPDRRTVGAVLMVLALALPTDYPSHEQIVGITFAVVTL